MKEEIISNIASPLRLEELYRLNPVEFKQSFEEAYESIKGEPIAEFWRARLKFDTISEEKDAGAIVSALPSGQAEKKFNLIFTVIAALLAGTIIKIPNMIGIPFENYIPYNVAFFVLPLLCIYYMIKNKVQVKNIAIFSAVAVCSILFMNLIPWDVKSDTRMLSSLHFAFIMWAFVGMAFTSIDIKSIYRQMQFLQRNGDVLMLTGIILICGMFLTGLTQGLFMAIGLKLPEFVFENMAIYGISASPIVANYMIESSPRIINRVTPFISKIFTPLILILMTVFIIALTFFAKDPFNSRQELIVFNVLLAVNLAVIVFSFSSDPADRSKIRNFQNKVLLVLSGEALLINLIALSAIVYRLFVFGISPNRVAVAGVNVLMFINLIFIAAKLLGYVREKQDTEAVHKSMVMMLPWYVLWAVVTAFIFPIIFWFK